MENINAKPVSPYAWRLPRPGYWLAACNFGPLGGFVFVLSVDAPKVKTLTPEYEKTLAHTLDGLAEIFGDRCEWMVTGALAIAATIGKFYRHHHDLDIAVEDKAVPQVVKVAQAAGYNLFHRMGSAKVWKGRRLTIFRRIQSGKILDCGDERIRLLHAGRSGWRFARSSLLDAIDIYPYHLRDGVVSSAHAPVSVPAAENPGGYYTTVSGRKLPLRNMLYMERIKRHIGGEKDLLDLEMMRQAGLLQEDGIPELAARTH